MVEFHLSIEPSSDLALCVQDAPEQALSIGMPYIDGGRRYEGEYRVRPQPYEQVLPTADRKMERDVVVEAIPSNYGLIEWDGSHLRVS